MSVQRDYYCDGPECELHTSTASPPPYLPVGMPMELRERSDNQDAVLHFCGWDCLMKYAAKYPPPEIVEID